MLPSINCDITKAATNVTIDFSPIYRKWRKYLVTLKGFLKISYYKIQKIVIEQNLYLIIRYSYFKREVSYYKILLLISVSRYYLQGTKIRYCPSLVIGTTLDNDSMLKKRSKERIIQGK